jgi:5-methyltetrahydrofolate--homocysteine methyltransferase
MLSPVMKLLLDALNERVLVSDGAMGTQLMDAGLELGGAGVLWNVTESDKVVAIQRRYVEAGSDCLITNTFSANGSMLDRHGLRGRLAEINRAAVEVARRAFAEAGREGWVLGDVGPVGGVLEMWGGDMTEEEAREAVVPQVDALVEAGADAIIVETQTDAEEAAIGVGAAKAAGAPCVIVSFAYDCTADGARCHTMMGVSPEDAARKFVELGADIIAMNCGTGLPMAGVSGVISAYRATGAVLTMAQPNAGTPEMIGGTAVYKQSPEEFAASVPAALEAGVNIVGGCCGSTPEHIAAIRRVVDQWKPGATQKP